MDALYCPTCRLVLYHRGVRDFAPQHCPRCVARSRRLVPLMAVDGVPAAEAEAERSNGQRAGAPAARAGDASFRSESGS